MSDLSDALIPEKVENHEDIKEACDKTFKLPGRDHMKTNQQLLLKLLFIDYYYNY